MCAAWPVLLASRHLLRTRRSSTAALPVQRQLSSSWARRHGEAPAGWARTTGGHGTSTGVQRTCCASRSRKATKGGACGSTTNSGSLARRAASAQRRATCTCRTRRASPSRHRAAGRPTYMPSPPEVSGHGRPHHPPAAYLSTRGASLRQALLDSFHYSGRARSARRSLSLCCSRPRQSPTRPKKTSDLALSSPTPSSYHASRATSNAQSCSSRLRRLSTSLVVMAPRRSLPRQKVVSQSALSCF
mmetsp:Transcript_45756/g.91279  ORF Transcript_45756/g.91279 Transcript_45756/m.91279 type:complete len:245 (+) Transcript_45756:127-861(+)